MSYTIFKKEQVVLQIKILSRLLEKKYDLFFDVHKTYNFTIKVRIVQMVYYYYKMVQVRQWYYVTRMKQK